jgi:hypothetical protein
MGGVQPAACEHDSKAAACVNDRGAVTPALAWRLETSIIIYPVLIRLCLMRNTSGALQIRRFAAGKGGVPCWQASVP